MRGTGQSSRRGQSEVLGIVLLFALVLTVSGAVVVVGGQALNDAQADTSSESAGITMEELQSKAAQSDGSTQRISFAQSGGGSDEASGANVDAADGSARIDESDSVSVDPSVGHITVTVHDDSAGTDHPVVDSDLGTISYAEGDRELLYQGGAIFRQNSNSEDSVMVSPPKFEFSYQNRPATLSLGITTIGSSTGISGDSFQIEQVATTKEYPASSMPNPLSEEDSLTVVIESEQYLAWGEFFDDRTDGSVTTGDIDGDGLKEAKLVLDGPSDPPSPTVSNAMHFGNGGPFTDGGYIDSYDSDSGPYPSSHAFDGNDLSDGPYQTNGPVSMRGGFQASNDPIIGGPLEVTGPIDTQGDLEVYGPTVAGEDSQLTTDGVYHSKFSVQGNLVVGGGSSTVFHDDVIIGGQIGYAFAPSQVGGSVYLHEGQAGDGSGYFRPASVSGSIHADESVNIDHWATINHGGDIYSNEDITVGSNLQQTGSNQKIHAGDDVVVTSGTHDVDIIASGTVTVKSGATVNGDVDADSIVENGDITGTTTDGSAAQDPIPPTLPTPTTPTVPNAEPANDEIQDHRSLTDSDNNDNSGSPTAKIANGNCADCKLEASSSEGDYALSGITLNSGDKLTLDTNGHDMEIYVDGPIDIAGEIAVQGEGQVRVYKDNSHDIDFRPGTNIHTPGDDATQFWMFMWPSGTDVRMQQSGSVEITGVLYGPGSGSSGAELYTAHTPVVKGAIVLDIGAINQHPTIHFDESLTDEYVLSNPAAGTSGSEVAYLQISTSTVDISD